MTIQTPKSPFSALVLLVILVISTPVLAKDDTAFKKGFTAIQNSDFAAGAKWFRIAADQGTPIAQFYLGMMYEGGHGVKKDTTQAVQWYRKAADLGFGKAQFNLALMYRAGDGVTKDDHVASEWYRKAGSSIS